MSNLISKYSYYEKLNIYFSNEQFNEVTDSLDEIFVLASLNNYIINFTSAEKDDHYAYRYALISIEQKTSNKQFYIYFNYTIIDNIFVFDNAKVYCELPCENGNGNEIIKRLIENPINNILDEIKTLI